MHRQQQQQQQQQQQPLHLQGSIVVVAKCPIAGKTKTRLIPLLGPEGSVLLARAMLSDILVTLSSCQQLDSVQKILLYAPPTPQGHDMMQQLLHNVVELHNLVDSWTLMPMLQEDTNDVNDDLQSSDLSAKLADALIRARQLQQQQYHGGSFPVVFLGMDSPEIPLDEICAALASPSTAVLCASSDGGYGMLSVPAHVADAHAVFSNMVWSHALTAICQVKALTDIIAADKNCTISLSIRIGKLMHDVDEPNDVAALARRLSETDLQRQQISYGVLDRPSSAAAVVAFGFDVTTTSSSSSSSSFSCNYTKKALERLGQLPCSSRSSSRGSNAVL